MRPQFPGMDPWLEHPTLWPDVHSQPDHGDRGRARSPGLLPAISWAWNHERRS